MIVTCMELFRSLYEQSVGSHRTFLQRVALPERAKHAGMHLRSTDEPSRHPLCERNTLSPVEDVLVSLPRNNLGR